MTAPNNSLTDLKFWQEHQPNHLILPVGGNRPSWYKHVATFLPHTPNHACLEIGVVPGNTLLFFASQLGYTCTGIDFSKKIQDTRAAFIAQGITAEFIQEDFTSWHTDERFDIVFSCGFIEHFLDYRSVIEKHWRLVRPGGLLLLTVPTMTPYQKIIRVLFYQRSKMLEILQSHNFQIMGRNRLLGAVNEIPGSEILVAKYVCESEIWFNVNDPGIRPWTKPFYKPVEMLSSLVNRTGISSPIYSPAALVLAKKVGETP